MKEKNENSQTPKKSSNTVNFCPFACANCVSISLSLPDPARSANRRGDLMSTTWEQMEAEFLQETAQKPEFICLKGEPRVIREGEFVEIGIFGLISHCVLFSSIFGTIFGLTITNLIK